MLIKILIFLLLLVMLYNLFKAMQIMSKKSSNEIKMSHYIGRRVLFSGLIMLLIVIALMSGAIDPNPRPY